MSADDYIGAPSYMIAWHIGMGYSTTALYMFLAPAFIALVYTDTLWIDRNTGFMNYILIRSKTSFNYIFIKYVVCLLSGGLLACLPGIIFFFVLDAFYPLNFTKDNLYQLSLNVDYHFEVLKQSPYLYLLLISTVQFCFGMVYSLIGLGMSALTNHRYLSLPFPYIVYLFGTYFCFPYFSPASTFVPNAAGFSINDFYIFKDFIVIGLVFSAIYFIMMFRKCRI